LNKPISYGLVGGFNPSEKYDFVSWDDEIPFPILMESHNPAMFQSPPSSSKFASRPLYIPRYPMKSLRSPRNIAVKNLKKSSNTGNNKKEASRNMEAPGLPIGFSHSSYPLLNVYSLQTGKSPSLRTVNQLFLWANFNTRWYILDIFH